MTYRHILSTRDGAVATITMNRPERRNALSFAHIDELIDALGAVAQSDARVVILAANGPVFCAGHDYGDMVERDLDGFRALFARCAEMMALVQSIPQPVVASVPAVSWSRPAISPSRRRRRASRRRAAAAAGSAARRWSR